MNPTMHIEQLKELIAARLDPDEILDILGWTTNDLVEALEDDIQSFKDEFIEAITE
jgi:hypothetical protein